MQVNLRVSGSRSRQETLPGWLSSDLRTDHAGELGAVWIYRGVLAVSRSSRIVGFAKRHLETERRHLAGIEECLEKRHRSSLLPLWSLLGFLTGALSALGGSRALYATIAAVETFVDDHYKDQIGRLETAGVFPSIQRRLEEYRLDEIEHRQDAESALAQPPGPITGIWCRVVALGSRTAVAVSRYI